VGGTLRDSGRGSRRLWAGLSEAVSGALHPRLRASPASRMSRSCPSAAALILAVAARRCNRRRRVGTSGPEVSPSSSGLWSCSVGELPTTGFRYLRAHHPRKLPCPFTRSSTHPRSPRARLSPASPKSGPAGCRLLRDVRSHASVLAHGQGQPSPEAPHPAQPLAELQHLCKRKRANRAAAGPRVHLRGACPLARPPLPRTSRCRLVPAAVVGRSSSADALHGRLASSQGAGARRWRAGTGWGVPHS
jgi:hypothetical protein